MADWLAVGRRWKRVEYVCKPGVMVALLGAAAGLTPVSGSQRWWFVAALAWSLAGDVFLMLDEFVPGLASFLVGHLCFIAGFVARGVSVGRAGVAVLALAAVGVVVGGRVLRALGPSKLRGPVLAYMTAITVMVACAVGVGGWLPIVGAALFYVSDACIAWNKFVHPWPSAKVVIIVTYHLAQFALVTSLVR